MQEEINSLITDFDEKITSYYTNSIFGHDILRNFNGTNIYLKDFFDIFKQSKYYRDETENDLIINKKIVCSLIDIVLINIMINEIDRIDNIGVNISKPKNEFETLYNISKDVNLINKTRILWERIMNFTYLLFERKDLEIRGSKKSKKKYFYEWYTEKGFKFFDTYYDYIKVFDEKYRTPENHKSSTLRKLFFSNESSPILGISLLMATSFGTNIYPNIIYILKEEPYMKLNWQRVVSITGKEVPEEFNIVPEWVKEHFIKHNMNLEDMSNLSMTIEKNKEE